MAIFSVQVAYYINSAVVWWSSASVTLRISSLLLLAGFQHSSSGDVGGCGGLQGGVILGSTCFSMSSSLRRSLLFLPPYFELYPAGATSRGLEQSSATTRGSRPASAQSSRFVNASFSMCKSARASRTSLIFRCDLTPAQMCPL